MSDWKEIFPCWGEHSRMGHKVVYGHFRPGPGETVICRTPAQEEDDDHEATPEDTQVLPMGGPAFYGFRLLDEEQVLERLRDRRPRKYKPLARPAYALSVRDQDACPQCGDLKDARQPYCSTGCMEAAEGVPQDEAEVIDGQEQDGGEWQPSDDGDDGHIPSDLDEDDDGESYDDDPIPF